MADCLFCRIASGGLPSAVVHEDARTFAFLDIHPLRPGHTLLVPKAHAAKLEDCSGPDAVALVGATQTLARALAQATGAPDCTIAINNGVGAGQEVQHVHVHIVPRKAGDGAGPVHAAFKGAVSMSSEEMHDLAVKVQKAVAAVASVAPRGA